MQIAEFELARCFGRASLVAPIAANLGFVPLPGGAFCEDFNGNVCDVPSSVNACADDPPGLISPSATTGASQARIRRRRPGSR